MPQAIQSSAEAPSDTPPSETPVDTGPLEAAPSAIRYGVSDAIVLLERAGSAQAESIGALCTHLIATHIRHGRRALAVCASDQAAGADFVTVNLAVGLAQAGIRTLLVDGNMRAPVLETMIAPSAPVPTLHQLLTDDMLSVSEAIQANALPNLSLLYSGGPTANAQELLNSARFKQMLDTCMRDHEATLVLTPPANRCADARRIASVVRYALVVARRDVTFVDDLSTLIADLTGDGAKVIGSVMNV